MVLLGFGSSEPRASTDDAAFFGAAIAEAEPSTNTYGLIPGIVKLSTYC